MPEIPSKSVQIELVAHPQSPTSLIQLATLSPSGITDDDPMTDAEFQYLNELETRIKENWQQIARDCKAIRESKLYRRTREGSKQTWDDYCKRVWDQTKQYVDRTIRAIEVIETLKAETKVSVFPKSVSQAAPLSGLKPDEMAKATEMAIKAAETQKRSVTAEDYKKAAETMKSPKSPKSKKPSPALAQPNNAPKQEAKPVVETSGSVVLNINNASLVSHVRELFEDANINPTTSDTSKGKTFACNGSAATATGLLNALASLVKAKWPLNFKLDLE